MELNTSNWFGTANSYSNCIALKRAFLLLLCLVAAMSPVLHAASPPGVIVFNDDGGWCWFQDPRALVLNGTLVIGSVASGFRDPSRRGNIEVTTYNLSSGSEQRTVLHERLSDSENSQYDDHNTPALLVRPDGRILAVYAKHGPENHYYYRISTQPGSPVEWQAERTFVPSASSQITYSNLVELSAENNGKGRIYDFFRGLDGRNKPSYAWSDDQGETWQTGNVFIDVPGSFPHRPYAKYATNGIDTVHIFYSDGHPNEFKANSNYHIYYKNGTLYRSDGTRVCELRQGLTGPEQGTRIFHGDAEDIAWTSDIRLDRVGRAYVVYSVRKMRPGAPQSAACEDHRYHYAWWDGKRWLDHEIAYAGSCLYAAELDYTGNITLDPRESDTVYVSANVDPKMGTPLQSRADGKRHYEIFRGKTADGGATWDWTAITKDSSADNLRPLVPDGARGAGVLLWLHGTYRAYTDYELAVVGMIGKHP